VGLTARRDRRTADAEAARPQFVVRIDELVLDGIDRLDGDVLGRSIEAVLADRLADHVPSTSRAPADRDVLTTRVAWHPPVGDPAAVLGESLGAAVADAIRGDASTGPRPTGSRDGDVTGR